MIEVNISGEIQSFPVSLQAAETFVVQCNVGVVQANPMATVRAHCTIDGYSSWFGPIQIPEFSSIVLFLMLLLVTALTLASIRKAGLNNHG
ncbi:MAG TPA: hypothetical protein VIH48_01995 [Candidatus Bathyarchaeia archaeon]